MSTIVAPDAPDAEKETTFLGHPIGLTYLFGTEMWERFSYYGNRVLLPIYLTGYLLLPGRAEHVIGYTRRSSTSLSGCSAAQSRHPAAAVGDLRRLYRPRLFHAADRRLSRRQVVRPALHRDLRRHRDGDRPVPDDGRRAVSTSRSAFFMIVGNGAFKPNISTQVGGLYKPGDHRIDRAYSIFYVGINVGSLLGQTDLRLPRRGGRLALWLSRRPASAC